MTNFTETALSVFNSPPVVRPGSFLKALPGIVRRFLPHARYSSFLETLVAGSHPDASSHKTPSLAIQDEVRAEFSTMNEKTPPDRTRSLNSKAESHISPSNPTDLVFRILYQAHGKFAWMNGKTIEDVRVLKWLGEGIMSSAHIKSGNIGDPRRDRRDAVCFNYICKTWDMAKMGQWNGFYSELALYKSSRYLLPLQGDVVPHIMGVYTRPGKIDIAMDLPHPIFWMEASASMPTVLKDRVVESFQKLHERGVLHGDVALRHILIGADARVTLIDFQASRADEPNEDIGLEAAYPGEKDLEMRRVKFLLNMDNARKREFRKSKAALRRSARNKEREQRRQELLRHGITVGLPFDEPEPLEDIKEPPVSLDELEKYWMEDANDDPRRFVVPGSSDFEVAGAISSFLQCIQDMEKADCGWSDVCNGPSSPRSPLASPFLSPHRAEFSNPKLPPSIKIRDFAYESTCWPPSFRLRTRRDMENLDSLSTQPPEDGIRSSVQSVISPRDANSLKRQREDGEKKAIYVDQLPAGKRARLDISPLEEFDVATVTETSIASDFGLIKATYYTSPKPIVPRVSTHESDRLNESSPLDARHKRLREAAEVDDSEGESVNGKKCRVSAHSTSDSAAISWNPTQREGKVESTMD